MIGAAISVVGLTALRIALAVSIRGPMIAADEYGYLFQARYIAGIGSHLAMGAAQYYPPFYALLLAPLAWLTKAEPVQFYRSLQALNIGLLVIGFVLFRLIARQVFGLKPWHATAAATLASAYPAYIVQAGLAWPETLLPVLFAGLVLAINRLDQNKTTGVAVTVVVLAVAMYASHARAIALPPLVLLGLTILAWKKLLSWRTAAIAIVLLIALTLATRMSMHQLQHALWSASENREASTLSALTSLGQWPAIMRSAAGTSWYLLAGTFGLVAIGVWHLVKLAMTGRARIAAVGTLASCAGILFVSAAVNRQPSRADQFVYGRYVEIVVGVLLVAAVAAIIESRMRWQTAALVAAATTVLALVLDATGGRALIDRAFSSTPTTAILTMRELVGELPTPDVGIRLLPITVLAIGGLAVLVAAARLRPLAPAALVLAMFIVTSVQGSEIPFRARNASVEQRHTLSDVADRLAGTSALSYDLDHRRSSFWAYQHWIPTTRLLDFRSSETKAPNDLVITSKKWTGAAIAGAHIAFLENDIDQALWVMPGPRRTAMQRAGFLLPDNYPSGLPSAAYRSRLEPLSSGPIRFRRGESSGMELRVTHEGTGSPWPQRRGVPGGVGGVDIGAIWMVEGREVRVPAQGALPRMVYPKETVRARLSVTVPSPGGTALAPGRYRLGFVLVQRRVAWFDRKGDSVTWVDVEVQ